MSNPYPPHDERFWTQAIDETARRPEAWLDTARRLKRAADVLAPTYQSELHASVMHGQDDELELPPHLGPVYMMLAGYAIENLAKGLIVSRDPDRAPRLTRHLDEQLIAEAGVELVDGEPALVKRLRVFLESFGRYPVPLLKDASKFVHTSILDHPMSYSTNDPNLVDALYARMAETLEQAVPSSARE